MSPSGLSVFSALKRKLDDISVVRSLYGERVLSLEDLRQKTSEQLRLLSDEENRFALLASLVADAPAGDVSLMRALAREHSSVLAALAQATGKVIWVLSFEALPRKAEGCADGAARDWALENSVEEKIQKAEAVKYPRWTEYAVSTAISERALEPDPALIRSGATICLVHLLDHHFDLLDMPAACDKEKSVIPDPVRVLTMSIIRNISQSLQLSESDSPKSFLH